jgi:hypothetical protein
MDEKKFDILKTEFLLTQQQMDKYDQSSTTIKAWSVTLWVASSGWALQSGKYELFLLGIVLVLTFWFFDGINKTFRTNYKKRRDEVALLLAKVFKGEEISSDVVSPSLPKYDLSHVFSYSFTPHIALPYIVFLVLSLVFFFIN